MFCEILGNVKAKRPLVHNITNYVTANDVANAELAAGGFPVMADCLLEAEEIVSRADGLNINIGTLNEGRLDSMIAAGKKANELDLPIVLDLVGAGASEFRKNSVKKLLKEIRFDVLKGNLSEIKSVIFKNAESRGVDVSPESEVKDKEAFLDVLKRYSQNTGAVIVVTGEKDIVSDSKKAFIIKNGSAKMTAITGAGCMLSGIIGVYAAANRDNILEAAASAAVLMGVAGEKAESRMSREDGCGSFKVYLMDALSNLTCEDLTECADYEIR